jgi:hypothetical protein
MPKWKSIEVNSSDTTDELEDDSLNENEIVDEDETDLADIDEDENVPDEDEEQDDAGEEIDLDALDDDSEQEEDETPPPKKKVATQKEERKPSRSEARIRELVAEKKRLEEQLRQQATKVTEAETRSRTNEKSFVESDIARIKANIESTQRVLKKAIEDTDPDALIKAQTELTQYQVELMASQSLKSRLDSEEKEEKKAPKAAPVNEQPKPSPLALRWKDKNADWFGQDEALTGAALAINHRLLESGYDPNSKEFYDEIDKRMSKLLGKSEDKKDVPAKKKTVPMGESSKSSPPSKVQVTEKDKEFARKMGINPKEYLAQKARYELNQQKGVETYKPIVITKDGK